MKKKFKIFLFVCISTMLTCMPIYASNKVLKGTYVTTTYAESDNHPSQKENIEIFDGSVTVKIRYNIVVNDITGSLENSYLKDFESNCSDLQLTDRGYERVNYYTHKHKIHAHSNNYSYDEVFNVNVYSTGPLGRALISIDK